MQIARNVGERARFGYLKRRSLARNAMAKVITFLEGLLECGENVKACLAGVKEPVQLLNLRIGKNVENAGERAKLPRIDGSETTCKHNSHTLGNWIGEAENVYRVRCRQIRAHHSPVESMNRISRLNSMFPSGQHSDGEMGMAPLC